MFPFHCKINRLQTEVISVEGVRQHAAKAPEPVWICPPKTHITNSVFKWKNKLFMSCTSSHTSRFVLLVVVHVQYDPQMHHTALI